MAERGFQLEDMKKIIFSRKGFDSASGGVPSPIFPDGRMLSLPIPDKQSPIRYKDIKWNEYNLGMVVSDLTNGRIYPSYGAHLDPDIDPQSLRRHEIWKPIFGQVKAAQGHLRNQHIQAGDIFLFYGLFRKVVIINSQLKFASNKLPMHVIWGWLQIDKIINVDSCDKKELKWAMYHPHFHTGPDKTNTVYIAKENLCIPGIDSNIAGAGIFSHYHAGLQLTKSGSNKLTVWHLPEWIYPTGDRIPLTYHTDLKRWEKDDGYVLLNTVRRGQEFVLDCTCYPEAKAWLEEILTLQE